MEEPSNVKNRYLRKIFESIQDGIIIMDDKRKILTMNPSAKRLTGWNISEAVPYCSFCQNRKTELGENKCYLIENDEEPYFLSKMPVYHGVSIDVEMSTAVMYTEESSDKKEYLLVLRDQTMQIKEEDARFSKLMIKKLIEAKETEHKRLAQELHDGVGQSLFSISVALQAIESYINNPKLNTYIEEVRKELQQVMEDIKAYSYQLRPHSIDQLGLVPTLRTLVESIQHHHPEVTFTFSSNFEERCNSTVEINLYRVVQEALHNVTKYADANEVSVRIERKVESGVLVLEIIDDGKGFERSMLTSVGLGLKHMEERVDQLGGIISINSEVNRGTNIYIEVPKWEE